MEIEGVFIISLQYPIIRIAIWLGLIANQYNMKGVRFNESRDYYKKKERFIK